MLHNTNYIPDSIKYNEFIQRYWTTNALRKFCTIKQLSSTGNKQILFEKIASHLLKANEICRHLIEKQDTKKVSIKFDLATRNALKNEIYSLYGESIANKFTFTVGFQKIIKTLLSRKETLTSRKMAEIWYHDYCNKINSSHVFVTSDACQMNRFSFEFALKKPEFKSHGVREAWAMLTQSIGQFNYAQYEAICHFITVSKIDNVNEGVEMWNIARSKYEAEFFTKNPMATIDELASSWNKIIMSLS